MKAFASLFSGGGLADIGARQANLSLLWAIEYDAKIADCYRSNLGEHVIVSPVQDVGYDRLETPYWLHMSPPCTNASVANTKGGETELDVELAQACIRAISALLPPVISLENVFAYRHFESFKLILKTLSDCGYAVKYWHLNSANVGVPQTRKRLFLVASRIKRPHKPPVTHQKRDKIKEQQLSFFPLLPWWVGWLEAIEDLIPTLPDSRFAPWQIPLLPEELQSALLVGNSKTSREGYRHHDDGDSPAHTITTQYASSARAFVVDGQTNKHKQTMTIRQAENPIFCLSATQEKRVLRAYTDGRVVRMTPKALARFQSMPDWYVLPEKSGLACTIIGNGVPCLMMERLIEANL